MKTRSFSGRLAFVMIVLLCLPSAGRGDPFSIVALPDTQIYSQSYPETFTSQTQWIVDNQSTRNISFVTHLGDLVNVADDSTQWQNANASMNVLHGQVPYSACMGNHDVGSYYDSYFGPSRYSGMSWYGGGSTNSRNHYQTFSAGGYDFLHLNLQFAPDAGAISWAQSVLDANPGKQTIVSTHSYLDLGGYTSQGSSIWNSFVRSNSQIFMVLCGHMHGENQQVSTNDAGGKVIEMLSDYQTYSNGGDGYLRTLEFDAASSRINVQTYSPTKGEYLTDSDSQLSYDVTFGSTIQVNGFIEPPPDPPPAYTITLQQGISGYGGTVDTELKSADPDAVQGANASIKVDSYDGSSPGPTQGLVRFSGLVGDNAGRIRPGMNVTSAALTLNVTNEGSGLNAHRALVNWNESSTWNGTGAGIQADGVEAQAVADDSVGANNSGANVTEGTVTLDVTSSVAAWANGQTNRGWAILPFSSGTNGIVFDSSEDSNPLYRPKLTVIVEMDPSLSQVVFQNGRTGYSGTSDTELRQAAPDTSQASATGMTVDADDGGGKTQGLIRFDDLFGSDEGQVPYGSDIALARLILDITNPGSGFTLHRMLCGWDETDTWNSLGDGIQADDVEAMSIPELVIGANNDGGNVTNGLLQLDVTDTLRSWIDGEENWGWILLPLASGTNGIDFYSSEYTLNHRPMLVLDYAVPEPATILLMLIPCLLRRRLSE
ncbi:MAG: DNRLRE domain-containing protein [Phycisphaerae bacterium]|nr:DNRLRE domain-containing protein [Phycisphaerae bacterium]